MVGVGPIDTRGSSDRRGLVDESVGLIICILIIELVAVSCSLASVSHM